MTDDPKGLQSLLADVHSALEYMEDLGLADLCPGPAVPASPAARPGASIVRSAPQDPAQSREPRRPEQPGGRAQNIRKSYDPDSHDYGTYDPGPYDPAAFGLTPSAAAKRGPASPPDQSTRNWAPQAGRMRPGPEEVLTGSSTPLGRRCPPPQNLPSLDTSWIEGAKTLDELHQALKSCRNCNLSESRSAVIPGRGPAGAPVFFVFDTPDSGALESRRIPNGPEAELFDNIVTKGLKLKPEDVYVTAISKCPLPDPSAFDGTYPMKACSHTLFREIELVRPKAVVALGARPAQILSGLDKKSFLFLKRMNMVIGRAKDIPFKVTFDLPTIMDDIDIKKEFWRDLKEVMKRL